MLFPLTNKMGKCITFYTQLALDPLRNIHFWLKLKNCVYYFSVFLLLILKDLFLKRLQKLGDLLSLHII